MPTPGVRPIVYPGGSWRTSREVARLNDEHSPDRLPEHKEIIISAKTGSGYDDAIAQITKYNAVTDEEAEIWMERMLFDPASSCNASEYSATILGVRIRMVGLQ